MSHTCVLVVLIRNLSVESRNTYASYSGQRRHDIVVTPYHASLDAPLRQGILSHLTEEHTLPLSLFSIYG